MLANPGGPQNSASIRQTRAVVTPFKNLLGAAGSATMPEPAPQPGPGAGPLTVQLDPPGPKPFIRRFNHPKRPEVDAKKQTAHTEKICAQVSTIAKSHGLETSAYIDRIIDEADLFLSRHDRFPLFLKYQQAACLRQYPPSLTFESVTLPPRTTLNSARVRASDPAYTSVNPSESPLSTPPDSEKDELKGQDTSNKSKPITRLSPVSDTSDSSPPPSRVHYSKMPKDNYAAVEQDNPSKVPVLTEGEISPSVLRTWEQCAIDFLENKEIADDKAVRKVSSGFRDQDVRDWLATNRDRLYALKFDEFMVEVRSMFLERDWEGKLRSELLTQTQKGMAFKDYLRKVQAKNALLKGTSSALADDKLRHQIEAGLDTTLATRARLLKTHDIKSFKEWADELRRIDELIATERADVQRMMTNSRDSGRQKNVLSEPSRRANVPASSKAGAKDRPPRLTDSERELLRANRGCFTCRIPFVEHKSDDCDNYPAGEGYREVTQATIDAAKKRMKPKPVGAVAPPSNRSPSRRQSLARLSPVPSSSPVQSHPVGAVMGMSGNPVAYEAPNEDNVLSSEPVEFDVSTAVAVIQPVEACSPLEEDDDVDDAPLSVPHLFWNAVAVLEDGTFPVETLIDHGSHVVLIRPDVATRLNLEPKTMERPERIIMAMNNGEQKTVILDTFVTLRLADPFLQWTSKPVRAILAPDLCVKILLSMPFLAHNKILVDAELRTATAKAANFDLLNPPTKCHDPARVMYKATVPAVQDG
ncbi:hypothetical protein HWV62_37300 [Athelia sp. TMB]|nr:hypothetical protein HWV62_37300 [Athelia sp. TMB]